MTADGMSCLHLKRSILGKGSGISNFRILNSFMPFRSRVASIENSVGFFAAQIAALKIILGDPLLKYDYICLTSKDLYR